VLVLLTTNLRRHAAPPHALVLPPISLRQRWYTTRARTANNFTITTPCANTSALRHHAYHSTCLYCQPQISDDTLYHHTRSYCHLSYSDSTSIPSKLVLPTTLPQPPLVQIQVPSDNTLITPHACTANHQRTRQLRPSICREVLPL
jgi:hypothetical protein